MSQPINMRDFLSIILEAGIRPEMSMQKQKSIFLLNRLSILLMVFFTFISIVAYHKLHSPIVSNLFSVNILIVFITFFVSKYLNPTISKYIVSIFIPISIVFIGAYAKSIGISDNVILYLAPRILLTITLFIPVLLFGYKEIKNTLLALFPGILVFILYDKIHLLFGVDFKELRLEFQYYEMFVLVIILFVIFVLSSILSLQSVNFKNELKLQKAYDELGIITEELKQQNEEILSTNNYLREQQKIIESQKVEMQKLLTAVEQSDSSVSVTDLSGMIEYINPSFTKLTGYEEKDIIGKNIKILKSGYHKSSFYKVLWSKINSGKVWRGTMRNKKKNNEFYWEKSTISPVKNQKGEVINFISIKEDISQRKEKEKVLYQAYITIEEKNRNITKSLNYAKRIQIAILPHDSIIQNYFTDYFIINRPVEIVGGDFYYFHENETEIILAVADCTGHGVPGGFMTMLGHAFLNNIINVKKVTQTGEILDELREMIINSLGQTSKASSSKDGMDISICKINKKTLAMQYSGAHNPILINRDGEQLIFKPDRMPIGFYPKMHSFATQEIEIQKSDVIYLFSDGFQDQFGGEYNQKYKRKRFYNFLLSLQGKNLSEQKLLLTGELKAWVGDEKQIDDILILGVEV